MHFPQRCQSRILRAQPFLSTNSRPAPLLQVVRHLLIQFLLHLPPPKELTAPAAAMYISSVLAACLFPCSTTQLNFQNLN